MEFLFPQMAYREIMVRPAARVSKPVFYWSFLAGWVGAWISEPVVLAHRSTVCILLSNSLCVMEYVGVTFSLTKEGLKR